MSFAFHSFLSQLHRHYRFTHEELGEFLNEKELKALKNSGLLQESHHEEQVSCQSCDDSHPLKVQKDGDEIYSFCSKSDEDRQPIDPNSLATWVLNVEAFLGQLALNLGIEPNVEQLELEGFWEVGRLNKDKALHTCYYYQGKHAAQVMEFIAQQNQRGMRCILFTNVELKHSRQEEVGPLLPIDVRGLIELNRGKIRFSKAYFNQQVSRSIRNVIFEENGELYHGTQLVARITPSTAEYYYADILYQNFNEPVSHEKIKRYICKKMHWEYVDGPSDLAHKQKSKIKKEAIKPDLVAKIFERTKDVEGKKAYIMQNLS